MNKSVKELLTPIIVLTCICLVVSTLLAVTNNITSPIITVAEEKAAEEARSEVLSSADSFEKMELSSLPESVNEVYRAKNGAGYVFMLTAKGYGGDMSLICGITSKGTIEACKTLSHSETSGLGSKTAEDPYRNQYKGKSADTLDSVNAISGATISSVAYKNAITDAFTAYKLAKEAE